MTSVAAATKGSCLQASAGVLVQSRCFTHLNSARILKLAVLDLWTSISGMVCPANKSLTLATLSASCSSYCSGNTAPVPAVVGGVLLLAMLLLGFCCCCCDVDEAIGAALTTLTAAAALWCAAAAATEGGSFCQE